MEPPSPKDACRSCPVMLHCDLAGWRTLHVSFGIWPDLLHPTLLLFVVFVAIYLCECRGVKSRNRSNPSQLKMEESKDIEPAKADITAYEKHPQDDVENIKSVNIDENKNASCLHFPLCLRHLLIFSPIRFRLAL